MNCFFYDVTDVVNIINAGECGFSESNITNTRECGFSEPDITNTGECGSSESNITNTRECSSSECVKSTHSRITPGSIRATTRCTPYSEGVL